MTPFDQKEVDRIKKIDIPCMLDDGTNFTSQLMRLMRKSDPQNFYKLASVYPNEATAIRQWEAENQHDPAEKR